MSTKDAYKQKIEAELELAKAHLEVMKAKVKTLSADVNLKYSKEIDEMEDGYTHVKSKLHELGKASESTWEDLKEETQNAWNSLSTGLKNIAAKIKE